MNPFKLIAGFVRWLWQTSMLLRYPFDSGERTGSRAAGLYMFLVLFFLVVGVLLVSLGFDLDRIDRWLDANGSGIEWAASLVFRLFCGLIFVISLTSAGLALFALWQRFFPPVPEVGAPESALNGNAADIAPEEDMSSKALGCWFFVLLAAAYFMWFGMMG